MGYLLYCDLCNLPIKIGDKKFIFAINEVVQPDVNNEINDNVRLESLQDLQKLINNEKEHISSFQICVNCKRVLDHFINLRATRIKKINKILEKLNKANKKITYKPSEGNGNV